MTLGTGVAATAFVAMASGTCITGCEEVATGAAGAGAASGADALSVLGTADTASGPDEGTTGAAGGAMVTGAGASGATLLCASAGVAEKASTATIAVEPRRSVV